MLNSFKTFLHKKGASVQSPITLVCYQRGGIPFVTKMQGEPGGHLYLTDEECSAILREVDVKMYTGEKLGELTAAKLNSSATFKKILRGRNLVTQTPSPSFT